MGSLTIFSALTFVVATVLLYSQAAPVTEFFGPPQTIEGDSNVIYPNPERVEEMERFHRTNKDGSIEFKMALSNGHVQYQKISSKYVHGDKVQVYEGYISERYNDGRYGTRYYAADENGYRTSDVIVENKPPVLPSSGSYAVNSPQDIDTESSPLNNEDIKNKTQTLKDELVKIEHDLEDEQLSTLNLGSNITKGGSVASNELGLKKPEEQDAEKPLIEQDVGGIQTDLPPISNITSNTEVPLISKSGEVSDESESSTLSGLEERSSTAESGDLNPSEHNENADTGKMNGKNLVPFNTSEVSSEDDKDVPLEVSTEHPLPEDSNESEGSSSKNELPTGTTEILFNHEDTTTEKQAFVNDEAQEVSTEVSEILRTDDETSRVSKYPLENADSESTTLATVDGILISSDEEQVKQIFTEQPILGGIEDKSTSDIDSKTEANSDLSTSSLAPQIENESILPTEKSNEFEIKSEVSTELPLTDSPTTVNIADVTKESHEVSTETLSSLYDSLFNNKEAKSLDIFTDSILSEENNSPSIVERSGNNSEENISETSEKTSSENIEQTTNNNDTSTEHPEKSSVDGIITTFNPESNEPGTSTERKIDSDSSTEQPTALIGSEEKSIINESSTEILEGSSDESDKKSHEASTEVPSESEDSSENNKEARSLDISTELPLSEGSNSSSIEEGSKNGSEENISKVFEKNSSETIEETTSTIIKVSTEESSDDGIVSTTASTSEKSDSTTLVEKDSDSSTAQPPALADSEDKPSKNYEEKSLENNSGTELLEESSEGNVKTTEAITETTTEAEVLATTQENEEKTHGADFAFYPQVIHF